MPATAATTATTVAAGAVIATTTLQVSGEERVQFLPGVVGVAVSSFSFCLCYVLFCTQRYKCTCSAGGCRWCHVSSRRMHVNDQPCNLPCSKSRAVCSGWGGEVAGSGGQASKPLRYAYVLHHRSIPTRQQTESIRRWLSSTSVLPMVLEQPTSPACPVRAAVRWAFVARMNIQRFLGFVCCFFSVFFSGVDQGCT